VLLACTDEEIERPVWFAEREIYHTDTHAKQTVVMSCRVGLVRHGDGDGEYNSTSCTIGRAMVLWWIVNQSTHSLVCAVPDNMYYHTTVAAAAAAAADVMTFTGLTLLWRVQRRWWLGSNVLEQL